MSASADTRARRIAFRTVGCRLNQAETAELAQRCGAAGFDIVHADDGDWDVCVIQSCAITAQAERDTFRLARQARRRRPGACVAVIGCAAEIDGERVRAKTGADLVLGQARKYDLAAALRGLPDGGPPPACQAPTAPAAKPGAQGEPGARMPAALPRPLRRARALVRVQDGCAFGCAYCIVPRARPRAWQRSVAETVLEVRRLASAGIREIVLTGANLGTYRHGSDDLIALLKALCADTAMPRIRLSSIEPATVEHALIEAMAAQPRICRHLHLPLQSADDATLGRMGRRYRAAGYRAVIDHAAALLPGIGLGTDIIAGFPGETPAAHCATLAFVEAMPFSYLHVFPYSAREGTRAATMASQIAPALRRRRARDLIALGTAKRQRFAERFVGQAVDVLIERHAGGAAHGVTGEYLAAAVEAAATPPGRIARATVSAARDGRLLCRPEARQSSVTFEISAASPWPPGSPSEP